MPGILVNEAKALIAKWVCGNVVTDKGTNLQLGLFTNTTVSASTTLGNITEPTGGGYARITLTDGSWSGAAETRDYAEQTFTATGSAMTGAVYGAFICTTGTTPRLLAVGLNPAGPVTLAQGDIHKVDPSFVISG